MGAIGRRWMLLVGGVLVGVGLGVAGPGLVADLVSGDASGLGILGLGAVVLFVMVGIFDVAGIVAASRSVRNPGRLDSDGEG